MASRSRALVTASGTLNLTGTASGAGNGFYSFGGTHTAQTGISITGSGSIDTADSSKNTMTLSNQAGIQLIVKQNGPTEVTKAGVKLATISNNLINYIDGVSESF